MALLLSVIAKSTVRRFRDSKRQDHEAQAFWLAEGAWSRAEAQLGVDSSWVGETWRVAFTRSGVPVRGEVVVRVTALPGGRRVELDARYHPPEGAAARYRMERIWSPESMGEEEESE